MSRATINRSAVRQLLYSPSGPVVREVTRVARNVEARARELAPSHHGRLKTSIGRRVTVREAERRITARVGSSLFYAIYQEKGTGIYGPRGAPIRPRRAKRLVFVPKGGSRPVFAREVRGSPAVHYLTRALREMSPWRVRPGSSSRTT